MVASVRSGRRTRRPRSAQHREGLRRGDLMDQVQVDVQHRRRVDVSARTSCSQTFWNIVFGFGDLWAVALPQLAPPARGALMST